MKKALIIVSLLLMLMLSACSSKSESKTNLNNSTTTKEESHNPFDEIADFDFLNESHVNWYGRIETIEKDSKTTKALANTASGFEVNFYGTGIKAEMHSKSTLPPSLYVKVYVDQDTEGTLIALDKENTFSQYILASNLSEGNHTVKVLKATEEDYGTIYVSSISAEKFLYPNEKPALKIEAYGDSITCGYGILAPIGSAYTSSTCDGTETYVAKLSNLLNAQYQVVSMQGISLSTGYHRTDYLLRNAYKNYSIKSKTSWDFTKYVPDIILINIGTNDQLAIQSSPDMISDFIDDYTSMINNLHKNAKNAVIICVYNMMNMAPSLSTKIEAMVNEFRDNGSEFLYSYKASLVDEAVHGHPGLETNKNTAQGIYDLLNSNNLIK